VQGLYETLQAHIEQEKEQEAVQTGTELMLHEHIEELEGQLEVAQQES